MKEMIDQKKKKTQYILSSSISMKFKNKQPESWVSGPDREGA